MEDEKITGDQYARIKVRKIFLLKIIARENGKLSRDLPKTQGM